MTIVRPHRRFAACQAGALSGYSVGDALKICVIGSGLLGCLVALEASRRGARVLLVDRLSEPFEGASVAGEGKIHLGYVYARDKSERTARLLVEGAVRFEDIVARYCDPAAFRRRLSTPFRYRVLPGTLSDPDELAAFYRSVDAMLRDRLDVGGTYLGCARPVPARRAPADAAPALAAFDTSERAVDPAFLQAAIREAVAADPRIEGLYDCEVLSLRPRDGAPMPVTAAHGALGPFDFTINAAWDGRLRLDASLGHRPGRPHLHRRKAGMIVCAEKDHPAVESATLVLGPFGDVVNYGRRRFYLSWYPSGCIGRSADTAPPADWLRPIAAEDESRIAADAIANLASLVPGLADVFAGPYTQTLKAGAIFSWGAGDVGDLDTELHERFDIGPRLLSQGYISVDTGKLSMAPLFAERAVEMMMAAA